MSKIKFPIRYTVEEQNYGVSCKWYLILDLTHLDIKLLVLNPDISLAEMF